MSEISSFCSAKRMHSLALVFLALLLAVNADFNPNLPAGSPCRMENGQAGQCTLMNECSWRLEEMKRIGRFSNSPGRCGFDGFEEIVCCPLSRFASRNSEIDSSSTSTPVTSTVPTFTETTSQHFNIGAIIPPNIRPALKACILVERIIEHHYGLPASYVSSGIKTATGELPHMVALGYRKTEGSDMLSYDCAGTLISDQHILTAAHCVINNNQAKPAEAKLGATNLYDQSEYVQNIKISESIAHPRYRSSMIYFDIAVLKLERPATMTQFVRPLCLQTTPFTNLKLLADNDTPFVVAGWGATQRQGDASETLQKTPSLQPVNQIECAKSYTAFTDTRLPRGIDNSLICLVDRNNSRSSGICSGDSGGPLAYGKPPHIAVIGVTSSSQSCGNSIPALFTNVYFFLDWIEETVWPSQAQSWRQILMELNSNYS